MPSNTAEPYCMECERTWTLASSQRTNWPSRQIQSVALSFIVVAGLGGRAGLEKLARLLVRCEAVVHVIAPAGVLPGCVVHEAPGAGFIVARGAGTWLRRLGAYTPRARGREAPCSDGGVSPRSRGYAPRLLRRAPAPHGIQR